MSYGGQFPLNHKAPTFGFLPQLGYDSMFVVGNVFFVDSGSGNKADDSAHGKQPDKPLATIEGAFNHADIKGNNGDVIFVAPGHTEDIDGAAAIDMDVAGVRVIGLGEGRNRPTITWSSATGDIDIDAANITIENFYFDVTGIDSVDAAIDVNAADFTFQNCEVLGADGSGQMDEFILTDANADRMKVLNNVVASPNAGADNFVSLVGATDGIEIAHNHVLGDFTDACLHNPTGNTVTNLWIHDNYLQNDQSGDHAIELVSACTGVIMNNQLRNNSKGVALDPGSCAMFDNTWCDSAVDTASEPIPDVGVTGVGAGAKPQTSHVGEVFYVDAGHGDATDAVGFGTAPSSPFSTIDYAITACTASNGDTVYVMAGHTETMDTAGEIALDVIGVRVIGLGEGRNRPTIINGTGADGSITITAANCTLENFYFDPTAQSVTNAVLITGADATVRNCTFLLADGGDQCLTGISTSAARTKICNNIFEGTNAGAGDAIEITSTPDGVEIMGNHLVGNYSNAGIQCASAPTNVLVKDNFIENQNSGNHAIQFSSTATGLCLNNTLRSDAVGTSLDPGSMACSGNKWSDYNLLDSDSMNVPMGVGPAGIGPLHKLLARTDVTTSMAGGFDNGTITIFTVTGDVIVWGAWFVVGSVAVTSAADSGTWTLGAVGNIGGLQAQTTVGSGVFGVNEVWSNAGVEMGQTLEDAVSGGFAVSGDGTNIILTVASGNTTAGVGDFYCIWSPVSAGSSVVGSTI